MDTSEWALVAVCVLALLFAIGVHLQTLRWIRRMVAADREITARLRLVMEDVLIRDPQLAESIELALHELDDWDKRMRFVARASFMRSPEQGP